MQHVCDLVWSGIPPSVYVFFCSSEVFILHFTMCRKRTSHDNIIRIVELAKTGMNGVEISKQIGLHPRTVQKLIKKWDEGGRWSFPTHSHGGGIPSIYTPRTLCNIKRQLDCNPTITARQLKEQNPNILGNVGVRSIQRAVLEKLHYKKVKARSKPLLTDRQRKRRILFAKKHSAWSDEDWSGVLWSDEATFFTSDTKGKKVWRGPGSDPCNPKFTAKTVKHPPSLMVWGWFGYRVQDP